MWWCNIEAYCYSDIDTDKGKDVDIDLVVDLKRFLQRESFSCESRACYVENPRDVVFLDFAKVTFFSAKVSRKLEIMIAYHRFCER